MNIRQWVLYAGCWLLLLANLPGQTPPQAEQIKQRFEEGRIYYSAGQYQEALTLFAKNLALDPKSKQSLLFSGLAYTQLGEFPKAETMLDAFLQQEPSSVDGLIASIKTKQALAKTTEVERLRKELLKQRATGKDSHLSMLTNYEREMILQSDGSRISILERFEPQRSYVWAYLWVGKDKKTIERRLELAPVSTAQGTYVLGESKTGDQQSAGYQIFKTYPQLPSYEEAKQDALVVLIGGGK